MARQILGSLLTFLGIMATLIFWYEVIPLGPRFAAWNRDPANVLLMLAIWALVGGFSCLFLARHIANWAMKVELEPWDEADAEAQRARAALKRVAAQLKLKQPPQLGLYEQPEINAYIAGFSFKHSTLVLARGALQHLEPDDLDMLIARELLHFKSGDVHGLAFMEGMIFSFTLYVARMLAFLMGTSLRQTEEEATSSDFAELFVTGVLTLLLTWPGTLVFAWFSRRSAHRADDAAAKVFGREAYAGLLARLPLRPPVRREIFSDAFKLQSRPYPALLSWLTLQPDRLRRSKRFSV